MGVQTLGQTTEIGPEQFFGVTDQAASPTLVNVQMFDISHTAINSGTAILNIQTCKFSQGANTQMSQDANGQPATKFISGRSITCSLSVIPQGTTRDSTGSTGLLAAAAVPPIGAYCTITHAPVMAFGPFAASDNSSGGAFNSANWQITAASLNFNAGAGATIDLELIQYTASSQRPY